MTSGMFAHVVIFASYAGATGGTGAATGWGTQPTGNTQPTGVPTDLTATVMSITNWILGFVAVIATLIIIYGGVLYLTSAGSEDMISKAKTTIVYGIVGLIVCGLAYAMVSVVATILGGQTGTGAAG